MLKHPTSRVIAAGITGALALAALPGVALANPTDVDYQIDSPYAGVDWNWLQYKAGFHNHTTESDGGNTATEMLEQAYALGFNVYAMTDHNFTNTTWDRTDTANAQADPNYYLTTERMIEMNTGAGRDGAPGMIGTGESNEQSVKDHLNTFWTPDYLNPADATLESKIATVDAMSPTTEGALDPIQHINHPGRYYGGSTKDLGPNGEDLGALAASDPAKVARYVGLFNEYPESLVGMEIVNEVSDGDSYSDRILWDSVLQETMPERNVQGYANDDAHSTEALGYAYNQLLMPELSEQAVYDTMKSGAFYSSALVAKRELGADFKGDRTLPAPTITNIAVDQHEDSITITGADYNSIEWIADGQVIATGNTIDLDDHSASVNHSVRAQLIGDNGISFTNAFGIDTPPFNDIPWGTQFIDEIRWMKEQCISTGWDDGSYRPLQPVARDAMAAFLYRIAGSPSVAGQTEPFSDVTEADEHYDAIVWAYHTGVTTGWDDGTFRPLQPIERNAMMAFVHRYAGAPAYDAPTDSPFADLQPGDPFYTEIMWAHDNGITTGWPDGTFRPFDPTNRDATAAFLHRIVAIG